MDADERSPDPVPAAVAAAAARLERDADAVAARLAGRVHPELAGFPRHASVTRSTTRAVRALVASFADLVVRLEDGPPETLPGAAVAYVHDHVHHGIDLSVVLRAYRLGHEELWRHWTALLDDGGLDAEGRVRARDETGAALFGYMDVVSERVIAEYRAERERWARSAAARRAETVRSLLDGEDVDPGEASAVLRHDLAGTHLAAVVWSDADDEPAAGRLEAAAAAVAAARGDGPALVVPAGRRTLWAWLPVRGAAAAPVEDAPELPPGVRVALGEPAAGVAGFRGGHAEALAARRLARRGTGERHGGPLVRWREVAVDALLTGSEALAEAFAGRVLGDLGAGDPAAALLRGTLEAYLERSRSTAGTAAALGVHANTVGNRLRRCEELLGRPLLERPLELHAALRIRALADG